MAVGVKVLSVPSVKLVASAEVIVGATPEDATVRVKLWTALGRTPLVAVKVIGKVPDSVGVPVSDPPVKVTPVGSGPVPVMVGAGEPVAVGVKVLSVPSVKVVASAEVMAARVLPLGPGTADQVNPLGSEPLWVKVTSVFQLSVRTPELLAQARPASQIPLVPPVYRRSAAVKEPPATPAPHWKSLGMPMIWPVVWAVLTGP